jgi:hypothetical protein
MSLCFAFARKDATKRAPAVYAVEYITYNILHKRSDSIDIVADLFFPNSEDEVVTYYFLHRGDIDFKAASLEEILSHNNFNTAFLRRAYAPSLGCRIEDSGRIIGLGPQGTVEANLKDVARYTTSFVRVDSRQFQPTPFSLYELTVPPNECSYLRIVATIKGDVFRHLTKDGKCLDIYGGFTLMNTIYDEDIRTLLMGEDVKQQATEYDKLYKEFFKRFITPMRYDMVLTCSPQTYAMNYQPRTSDLFLGCEDTKFYNKIITWYWSLSPSFMVTPLPENPSFIKGPCLSVDAKEVKVSRKC